MKEGMEDVEALEVIAKVVARNALKVVGTLRSSKIERTRLWPSSSCQ
jgi:hypothetical protein